jgi:copper(I)-binding protein
MRLILGWLLACVCVTSAAAQGRLVIEQAWIRTAPPDAVMLAGYATLRNDGDAPVIVSGADSADFGAVSLHESVSENGIERMRPLREISIAPGTSIAFAPGGKHFMLMRPQRELKMGDTVKIHISTSSGTGEYAEFALRDEAR